MRPTRPLVVVVAGLALAFAAPAPADARLQPRLQTVGLQVALSSRGLYRGPIDAIAGPGTIRAVIRFQRRHGLLVDGIAGPQTRRALGRLGRPLYGRRVMRKGMVGWDVSVLQYLLLRSRSASGSIDGAFGPRTRAATIRFQRRAGLVPDGIVGRQTRRALWDASPGAVRRGLNRWSRRYGVSRQLVRSLAWVESGHQPHVVSSAGARGVMQVMPATRRYVERVLIGRPLPRTVNGNIQAGVAYLARQLRTFRPSLRRGVGAYYQGPAAVHRYGLYGETKRYVRTVLALRKAI
jgi:Transglycosylase SLT domain/Putative peptidoglycan binding domain